MHLARTSRVTTIVNEVAQRPRTRHRCLSRGQKKGERTLDLGFRLDRHKPGYRLPAAGDHDVITASSHLLDKFRQPSLGIEEAYNHAHVNRLVVSTSLFKDAHP